MKQLKNMNMQQTAHSFKSLHHDESKSSMHMPRSQSQCETNNAATRSKSHLSQTLPSHTKMKGAVAVPFLDLTKVVPNFSMKQ